MVIADPEKFGLTIEEIRAAYAMHGERIGVEGEARKELLLRIINHGWIRIRRYRDYWSVTADCLFIRIFLEFFGFPSYDKLKDQ
jgi:hypothetical protein